MQFILPNTPMVNYPTPYDNSVLQVAEQGPGGWSGPYWSPSPYPVNQQAQNFYYEYGLSGPESGMLSIQALPQFSTVQQLADPVMQTFVQQPKPGLSPYIPAQEVHPNPLQWKEYVNGLQLFMPKAAPCFIGQAGNILLAPPNAQCNTLWQQLHSVIPAKYHMQFVGDYLRILRMQQAELAAQAAAQESKMPGWLLPAGLGIAALLLLTGKKNGATTS